MNARRWAPVAGLVAALVVVVSLAGRPAGPGESPAAAVPSASPSLTTAPTSARSPTAAAPAGPSARPVPAFAHVFVVIMENKEGDSVVGSPSAPYINSLAERYGLATDYLAVAHPSQPNYFALWSGSTHGVTDNGVHDFATGQTLADQIEAAGRSWHVAAQNVPLGCHTGTTASGGVEGPGTYVRRHEPAISWRSVSEDPSRCANITDFSHFDPAAGDFWLIVPNLCNDMHDCPVSTGDAFLEGFLPRILDSAAFTDGVVFLTFDEGTSDAGGGGRVATLVISPLARSGFRSPLRHDHYSLLRTIEVAWDMPCLANACDANDLREFFR